MTNKNVLQHSGVISHQQAIKKAHREYEIYKEQISNRITCVLLTNLLVYRLFLLLFLRDLPNAFYFVWFQTPLQMIC
jgi:succinate dehydrogenase hydrophobic anchor subunit